MRLAILAALLSTAAFDAAAAADARPQQPLPDNVTIIAEVDGCRTYRVEDRTDQPENQPKVAFMNHVVYFTKCGGVAVPTTKVEAVK